MDLLLWARCYLRWLLYDMIVLRTFFLQVFDGGLAQGVLCCPPTRCRDGKKAIIQQHRIILSCVFFFLMFSSPCFCAICLSAPGLHVLFFFPVRLPPFLPSGLRQVSMQRINHRLRRFVGMSKLKKVALNVIAQQLTEAEIGHLRGVRCILLWVLYFF